MKFHHIQQKMLFLGNADTAPSNRVQSLYVTDRAFPGFSLSECLIYGMRSTVDESTTYCICIKSKCRRDIYGLSVAGHVVASREQADQHPVQRLRRHVRGEPQGQGEVLLRAQRRRLGCEEGQER